MIIEDRLTDDSGTVTPRPVAPVVVAPKTSGARWLSVAPWVMVAVLTAVTGWTLYRDRTPSPSPTPAPVVVDVTAAGKTWAKALPLTFCDSFEIARKEVMETDKPMDAIRKDHVERWKGTREAAFDARFEKAFDEVIPPGNDNPPKEDRRRYAEVMGKIIAGTREGAR